MQQSVVSMIISFYIFISTALLIFNLAYMLSSGVKKRVMDRRISAEMECQKQIVSNPVNRAGQKFQKRLYRRLKDTAKLSAFVEAIERNRNKIPENQIVECLRDCRMTIFKAAEAYRKRPAMERALFAYLISLFPDRAAEEYTRMGEILLGYLENSTVYCRQNVLQALYRLGNEDALVRALQIFQEQKWYHNSKLIADGLAEYRGDRVKLARRLWNQKEDEIMRVILIQFMNQLPEDMSDLVLPELSSEYHEVRFAAVRYFTKHINAEAGKCLLNILREDSDVSSAAAQALGSYPGETAKQELMLALQSKNWYVRHNSAVSLMKMNLSPEETRKLITADDRYVREMFTYVWESRGTAEC